MGWRDCGAEPLSLMLGVQFRAVRLPAGPGIDWGPQSRKISRSLTTSTIDPCRPRYHQPRLHSHPHYPASEPTTRPSTDQDAAHPRAPGPALSQTAADHQGRQQGFLQGYRVRVHGSAHQARWLHYRVGQGADLRLPAPGWLQGACLGKDRVVVGGGGEGGKC